MLHLAHCAPISRAELAEDYQILRFQIQPELYTNLQSVCAVLVMPQGAGYLRVAR